MKEIIMPDEFVVHELPGQMYYEVPDDVYAKLETIAKAQKMSIESLFVMGQFLRQELNKCQMFIREKRSI